MGDPKRRKIVGGYIPLPRSPELPAPTPPHGGSAVARKGD